MILVYNFFIFHVNNFVREKDFIFIIDTEQILLDMLLSLKLHRDKIAS